MSPRVPLFLAVLLLSVPAVAATRMTFDINGAPTAIAWAPTAFPLQYEIDTRLVALHANAATTVERAFAAWEAIPDTNVRFQARGVVSTPSPGRVTVSLAEGLLRDQGAAAVTAYTFDTSTGQMLRAGISIDPSLFDGSVNAALALQHEVGHILGLDHSAVLASVMYPYLGGAGSLDGLDSDDVIGLRATYPEIDPTLLGATITGRVYGDKGGIHAAQVVAVNSLGYAVGTVLTNTRGEFTLTGLPQGRYRLYAEPLDGPVDTRALQGSWRQAASVSFPTQFFDSTLDVESGKVYGNLVITSTGRIDLNPKWIGASPEGRNEISLSSAPVTLKPGDHFTLAVGGDGFVSSMTEFEVLNPGFRRVSPFQWSANYVRASYVLAPDAQPGAAVIIVRSGNESAALTGALRVQQAAAATRTRSVRR